MKKMDYRLPSDFSDVVMARVNYQIRLREKRKELLLTMVYILASVLAVAVAMYALIHFNIMSNLSTVFSFYSFSAPSFSIPSFSWAQVLSSIKPYIYIIVVGVNITILYTVSEGLAVRKASQKSS